MKRIIKIAEVVSKDLALRHNAIALFEFIDSYPETEIQIDFSGVRTITWSFAHEYLKSKATTSKTIEETNVPVEVCKMFEVVTKKIKARTLRSMP